MKFIHTADWHLGKLVQGVHMTEDQAYVLDQLITMIEEEKPDALIIAGDLYDRAVPPTEAVYLLDETLEKIVKELHVPVLAIGGNHDSPSRLNFGSKMMKDNGLHLVGKFTAKHEPVILHDEAGEVHFHLIPFADPSTVRNTLQDDRIRTHDDAMKRIIEHINKTMDPNARHVFVGHAFVTPYGEEINNTSDSERPLSIGGAEYVNAEHFTCFNYTALGHLHRAHSVLNETIQYAGSLLKYSISEENHKKGVQIVELNKDGRVSIERKLLSPRRDVRTIEGTLEELLRHEVCEDYVFVQLTDQTPVLSPMEKIRSVYPNAMHIQRKHLLTTSLSKPVEKNKQKEMSDLDLFKAFYHEVSGVEITSEAEEVFTEVLDELIKADNESSQVETKNGGKS